MHPHLQKAWRLLGSYGLACVLLLFLLLLTFLGTWEQQYRGLYDVQNDYFGSAFLIYKVGGVLPVPLPGVYLLLALLFVNLVVGGIIRMRKGTSTIGILITHVGILVLLGGGFWEDMQATKGQMQLYEGDEKSEFTSYYDWELAVEERLSARTVRESIVPDDEFEDLEAGERVRVTSPDLPFEMVLSGYARNAEPVKASDPSSSAAVDGYLVRELPVEREAEHNLPALFVTVKDKGTQAEQRAIVWGGEVYPYQFESDGRLFRLDLRKTRWPIDGFSLRLKRFVHENHPGTSMSRRFSSYVEKIVDGKVQDVHITMNEPLRYKDYIVFQSQWGQTPGPAGPRVYSVFAVVENPADRVPLIACVIIAVGLVWHWVMKLSRYLVAEAKRRAAAAPVT